jgi:hypothetical protein
MIRKIWCYALVLLIALAGLPVMAQQSTGSIRGVVQDAQGGVIPDAKVTLENQSQGSVTGEAVTNKEGVFIFNGVYPSTYSVSITAPGFKKYTQKDIVLRIGDNLGLPPVVMEIGGLSELVTVEANAQQLETVNATRSSVITGTQLLDLGLQARSFTSLLITATGNTADTQYNFNGQRNEQVSYSVDGVSLMETGGNQINANQRVSVDAIGEFKVVTNSQSAEYGRSTGATLSVVTKSGTRDFHGSGYFFKRGEWMNANSYTNNYNKIARPKTRVMIAGYTFSGPVYIPGVFNTNKDKLFVFASHEWNRTRTVRTQSLFLPTAAERLGNFSASLDPFAGKAVTIKDPATGKQFEYNGVKNVIPPSLLNDWGKKIMNFYPLPNFQNLSGPSYNDYRIYSSVSPIFDQIYRVDYNVSQNHRFFARIIRNKQYRVSPCGLGNSAVNNNLCLSSFDDPNDAYSVSGNFTSTLSSTTTNEFVYGHTDNDLSDTPPHDQNSPFYKSVSGLNVPVLYPNADISGMISNFTYGLGGSSPSTSFMSAPERMTNPINDFADNFFMIRGDHALKFGIFVEKTVKYFTANIPTVGTFDFSQDSSNPGDTGYAFTNALLGNFKTFQQASQHLDNGFAYLNIEWYAQDTWKLTPSFTLNYGMRFELLPPYYEEHNRISSFIPGLYDPAKKVVLYQPACVTGVTLCATGSNRRAKNPLTGELLPATYIGKIVPGVGDLNNGIVQAGINGYPKGIMDSRGVQWGPRIGIAWQPWGASSKTVIRAGGGIFYERLAANVGLFPANNPPMVRTSQVFYGNVSNFTSSGGVQSPVAVFGLPKDYRIGTSYNYNLSIQRELPLNLFLDVGYVGTMSRHLSMQIPFNFAPFGSAWLPQNQDPTKPAATDGSSALPVDMYRPYIGYIGASGIYGAGGIVFNFGGTSNYNGLQVSLKRRMGRSLQFGASYVFGKALGTASDAAVQLMHPTDIRGANYGPLNFDRRHSLTFDYLYNVPDLTTKVKLLNNIGWKQLFGGWQISGITSFTTGGAGGFGANTSGISYVLTTATGTTLNKLTTGSEDVTPRPVFKCNPKAVDATLTRYVDDTCIAPAPKGSIGNDSGINSIFGPGINNWDISVFKKFQYWKDREERYLQLRLEMYNAFNHTQWSNFNRSATIDPTTGKVVNLPTDRGGTGGRFGFGALSSNRAARTMQLAAKIYF